MSVGVATDQKQNLIRSGSLNERS